MLAALALLTISAVNPITDKNTFPIAVWLQSPSQAARYKAAGINLYVGLWQGPTEAQLAELSKAGIPVVCDQNAVGLKNIKNPIIVGWMHGDEPDNAQPMKDPATGKDGWGPFIAPSKIVEDYHRLKAADPSRPILLNLGQGVANDGWIGRGNGAKLSDYETYVKGCDIVSFDVYPVAGLGRPDQLGLVAKGIGRLRNWTGGTKRIWNCIEASNIEGKVGPSPAQVRAEVWSSILHGSTGLIYFVHQFAPTFNEHSLLDNPEMLASVTALNKQIQSLAPVLLSKPVSGALSENSDVHVGVRVHGGVRYGFAISLAAQPVTTKLTNTVAETGSQAVTFEPYELKVWKS